MDFPSYVPKAAREQVLVMLDGEPRGYGGASKHHVEAVRLLADLERNLQELSAQGTGSALGATRQRIAEAKKSRDFWGWEVECLNRLARDARMRPVYAQLRKEFADGWAWRSFISSAIRGGGDWGEEYQRMVSAARLVREIADTASILKSKLRELKTFHSSPPADLATSFLPDVLQAVVQEAHEWRPFGRGLIGAATKSRKRNRKTDYLRAFAYALTERHGIRLTSKVVQAMATTATVVLNDDAIDVNNDDARKALAEFIKVP